MDRQTINGYQIRFSRKGPGGFSSTGWWAYVPGFVPCFVEGPGSGHNSGRWFAFNGPRGLKVNRGSRQKAAEAWFNAQIAERRGFGAGVGVFGPSDITSTGAYYLAGHPRRIVADPEPRYVGKDEQ